MKNLLQEIQKLSELELAELIEGINEHCYKNKMSHLVEDDNDQIIEGLEMEIEDLKLEIHNLKNK